MDAAEAAGLGPVKVNVVPIAGVNDDEIESFAGFARATGRTVRFIEFMPLDGEGSWRRDQVVPADDVLARIDARWPIEAVPAVGADRSAPAERYRFTDGGGEVGVIASVTRPFCGTCNRLRLTADGSLRNCLFSHEELSVRDSSVVLAATRTSPSCSAGPSGRSSPDTASTTRRSCGRPARCR